MVGVAVNVTGVPSQIVLLVAFELIVTLGSRIGFTVIVTVLDVAGEPVRHDAAGLEVITTYT